MLKPIWNQQCNFHLGMNLKFREVGARTLLYPQSNPDYQSKGLIIIQIELLII